MNKDILAKSEKELERLVAQSDIAVSTVRSTVSTLCAVNQSIQEKADGIEEYKKRLAEVQTGLLCKFETNKQIIENFKKLLCME